MNKIVSLLLVMFFSGCATRNLYPTVHEEALKQPDIIRRQWTYPVEPIASTLWSGAMEYISPVLDESILVFGSSRAGLIALYPNLLRERWKIKIPHGIVSPISIEDHVAYFTDGDGNLVSYTLDVGKKNWSYALRNPVTSRPTLSENDLFLVTSDDAVISIESKTGKWQWHYRRRNTVGPSIHSAAAPLVIDDVVWAGFSDGSLVALSRNEGKVLWEKQLNSNKRFADMNADLIHVGDHVIVAAYDGALYNLNASTGATLWSQENLGGSRGAQVQDGVVYVGSSSGTVAALDEKSGKILWKFELDHPVASSVTVLSDHVVVSSSSQYLYLLERSTGKIVDRLDMGYRSGFSGPFIYDAKLNLMYGLSRGGNLLALSYHPKNQSKK
jgi:outer membrane protein assembly factor BamB